MAIRKGHLKKSKLYPRSPCRSSIYFVLDGPFSRVLMLRIFCYFSVNLRRSPSPTALLRRRSAPSTSPTAPRCAWWWLDWASAGTTSPWQRTTSRGVVGGATGRRGSAPLREISLLSSTGDDFSLASNHLGFGMFLETICSTNLSHLISRTW